MHGVTLHGLSARLVWGYRTAAELGAWTIHKAPGGWQLQGTITMQDAYQLRQRPLLLIVPRDRGFWTWPITTVTVQQARIQAVLGPPVQG